VIYLDTNAALFFYERDLERFSSSALRAVEESDDLRVSPMAVLELEFLHEIKRIRVSARRVTDTLAAELGVRICDAPFLSVVHRGIDERWTRDPFDRLIVAQARVAQAPLITKDRRMQAHYPHALG
jgi:PIN domain nuclease of toxin-antitoxin system